MAWREKLGHGAGQASDGILDLVSSRRPIPTLLVDGDSNFLWVFLSIEISFIGLTGSSNF